jgi:uncharacterized protein with PIN domain
MSHQFDILALSPSKLVNLFFANRILRSDLQLYLENNPDKTGLINSLLTAGPIKNGQPQYFISRLIESFKKKEITFERLLEHTESYDQYQLDETLLIMAHNGLGLGLIEEGADPFANHWVSILDPSSTCIYEHEGKTNCLADAIERCCLEEIDLILTIEPSAMVEHKQKLLSPSEYAARLYWKGRNYAHIKLVTELVLREMARNQSNQPNQSNTDRLVDTFIELLKQKILNDELFDIYEQNSLIGQVIERLDADKENIYSFLVKNKLSLSKYESIIARGVPLFKPFIDGERLIKYINYPLSDAFEEERWEVAELFIKHARKMQYGNEIINTEFITEMKRRFEIVVYGRRDDYGKRNQKNAFDQIVSIIRVAINQNIFFTDCPIQVMMCLDGKMGDDEYFHEDIVLHILRCNTKANNDNTLSAVLRTDKTWKEKYLVPFILMATVANRLGYPRIKQDQDTPFTKYRFNTYYLRVETDKELKLTNERHNAIYKLITRKRDFYSQTYCYWLQPLTVYQAIHVLFTLRCVKNTVLHAMSIELIHLIAQQMCMYDNTIV